MSLIVEQLLPQGTRVFVKRSEDTKIPGTVVGIVSKGMTNRYIIQPTFEGLQMIQGYGFEYTHFTAFADEVEEVVD